MRVINSWAVCVEVAGILVLPASQPTAGERAHGPMPGRLPRPHQRPCRVVHSLRSTTDHPFLLPLTAPPPRSALYLLLSSFVFNILTYPVQLCPFTVHTAHPRMCSIYSDYSFTATFNSIRALIWGPLFTPGTPPYFIGLYSIVNVMLRIL